MSNETGEDGQGWGGGGGGGDGEKWLCVCFCSVTLETHLKSLAGVIVFLCAFVFVLCLTLQTYLTKLAWGKCVSVCLYLLF